MSCRRRRASHALSARAPGRYALGLANLYRDFACALMTKRLGLDHERYVTRTPGVADGLETMALIEAAIESNDRNGARVDMKSGAAAPRLEPG